MVHPRWYKDNDQSFYHGLLNTFTRLNITGDFRTAFGNDNVKYGNYGLKIDLLTEEYELDYQSLYFKNSQINHLVKYMLLIFINAIICSPTICPK